MHVANALTLEDNASPNKLYLCFALLCFTEDWRVEGGAGVPTQTRAGDSATYLQHGVRSAVLHGVSSLTNPNPNQLGATWPLERPAFSQASQSLLLDQQGPSLNNRRTYFTWVIKAPREIPNVRWRLVNPANPYMHSIPFLALFHCNFFNGLQPELHSTSNIQLLASFLWLLVVYNEFKVKA